MADYCFNQKSVKGPMSISIKAKNYKKYITARFEMFDNVFLSLMNVDAFLVRQCQFAPVK